jgi:hypothetical protein
MANTRRIVWSAAMRDLRNDRAEDGAVVREEGLKAAAGLTRPLDLSSWRGRSGRRYVVGVRPLAELSDITDAVVLGVRRGADGMARIVDVAIAGPLVRETARRAWLSAIGAKGATELHVHRLAETDAERRAVLEDLRDEGDGGSTPGRGRSGRRSASLLTRPGQPKAAANRARTGSTTPMATRWSWVERT